MLAFKRGVIHMEIEFRFHIAGSRIKTLSDFGYVVMDISFVHVEDSGDYVCVATNKFGSDTTRCSIQCTGKSWIVISIILYLNNKIICICKIVGNFFDAIPISRFNPRFH